VCGGPSGAVVRVGRRGRARRSSPTTIERNGRSFDLFTTAGRIRQIAWRIGATRVWLTNTLQDTLSNGEMIALALSAADPRHAAVAWRVTVASDWSGARPCG